MRLSEFDKSKILHLHMDGFTNTEISKKLNVTLKTISLWINRYYNNGNMKTINVDARRGKLTLNQVFNIINLVSSEKYTIDEIKNKLNLSVSNSTIINILKCTGHRFGKNIKKPFLTEKQRIDRVDWCFKYHLFNVHLIEFSDEMTIWKDKNSSECWYKIGNKKIDNIKPHSKKYNVWGIINSNGEFYYWIFEENMNSEIYEDILFYNLIPFHKKENYFQQDNNSSHKTTQITNFLKDYDINTILWPSNSPDLNLIENIWGIIKQDISKTKNLTNENFLEILTTSLNSIKKETIINLYNSMQKRMDLVIINKGSPINY